MTREGSHSSRLLIVVAIIGCWRLLHFHRYAKFQARVGEVKVQLGAALLSKFFAAEAKHLFGFAQDKIGYNRDGTKFYYTVGYQAGAGAGAKCAPDKELRCRWCCSTYQWQMRWRKMLCCPLCGGYFLLDVQPANGVSVALLTANLRNTTTALTDVFLQTYGTICGCSSSDIGTRFRLRKSS